MKNLFIAAVSVAVLSACASRPESIAASYVSHEKYSGIDCVQLSTYLSDARAGLQKVSAMQDSKANMDAATVFLALVPASKLTGDHAADVAKFKGEVEAIETAQIRKGCKSAKVA
ncbi:hypothetical protein [Massilia sp. ST3]|uniref:hypothetical protein n=1 Tax=Massilia sp. ST3 TaxID=2824903 RepID=UPI001B829292|nr:hypothetical protein [Massilia sp. ST3]MBQ5949969.1 hypothetical protein [Massilia sp. ST3]